MEKFINDDFLLESKYAQELYHNYAKNQPLIDFHCHLNPAEISQNKKWDNITQVWLGGDHYKWRAMRSNGVDEKFITGDASDREKFQKFAETMPMMLRNPMYHWCHLELARFFGIDDVLLSGDTAEEIWNRANEVLKTLTAKECMIRSNVEAVCTTDDPTSDLKYHKEIAASDFKIKVHPTFRPDRAFAIEDHLSYIKYLEQLEKAADIEIRSYDDLLVALKRRHDYFHENGCRVSDYGIETIWYKKAQNYEIEDTFQKAISSSEKIAPDEATAFKDAILRECAAMDCDKGWVRQLHIGPLRNNNKTMFEKLGADSGFDSIGESNYARALSKHLDNLNTAGKLGKTIIYNIHPKDNEMIAAMLGNFQNSDFAGKIQLGSAWWFMDNLDGMRRQLEAVSNLSLLGRFVGMLTDSRSFLSYTRHEYFRRLLCNILGDEMQRGLLPKDIGLVGNLVANISYKNPKAYFNL
ncbi:MAG: glucuronate isomerase [Opitutales bacterium]|nr:glucuronate isomerase [Opitutales bacterium]